MFESNSHVLCIKVERAGHLRTVQVLPRQDFHALAAHLAELPEGDSEEAAVLVLGHGSTTSYLYSKE